MSVLERGEAESDSDCGAFHLRFKMELKEKKLALRGVIAKLRKKAVEAKEVERLKLQAGRERKLRNRLRSEQYQVCETDRQQTDRHRPRL